MPVEWSCQRSLYYLEERLSEPLEDVTESDEDAIVREMMAANGNTIDYSI